jgi:hypothetical protein
MTCSAGLLRCSHWSRALNTVYMVVENPSVLWDAGLYGVPGESFCSARPRTGVPDWQSPGFDRANGSVVKSEDRSNSTWSTGR